MSRRDRRQLEREATDLAEASFAADVTPCRLIWIEAHLLQIDARLSGRA